MEFQLQILVSNLDVDNELNLTLKLPTVLTQSVYKIYLKGTEAKLMEMVTHMSKGKGKRVS